MSRFLRWFFVTIVMIVLVGCSHSDGKAIQQVVQTNHEDITVTISEDTYEEIIDTTPPEDNTSIRVLKLSRDAASTIDIDKKYIDIPAFTDERFPFGYIGKIVGKTENDDGSISYETKDLEVKEALKKIKFPEETLEMKDMVIADIIVPEGVTPLDASGKKMKIAGSSSSYKVKAYKEKVSLKYEVKFDNYIPSSSGNSSAYQKLSFIVDGVLKNLKITKEADVKSAKSGAIKLIAEADLSASIKTEMLGSILFGKYDKFWKDAEKKAINKGLSIKGLKSIDKQGKIPLAGLVIYPSTVYPMTGTLPKTSIKYQPIGMLVWIYLDLRGTLTLHGSLGIEVNNHLKVGFEKKAGEKNSHFIGELSKIENKPLLKMPYIKGNAKLEANVGVSLDIDLFAKGLRFVTASSEIGANYVREFKVDKEIYYGVEDSYSEPFAWHGGAVCSIGNAGIGARQYAGIALGVEYKKNENDRPKWSLGFDGFWQYPDPKDIAKVTEGRVGNSLWWVLRDIRTCFNLKTTVSDIAKLVTHLDRYRASYMGDKELRNLSDQYYAQAYLSKRIYDESDTDEGKVQNGWRLEKLEYDFISGFKAGLYQNTLTNQYAIVYGGTTATLPDLPASAKYYDQMVDLLADATLLANVSWKPKQAIAAIDFLKTSAIKPKIDNGEVSFIAGHSLGGGLAQLAGIYTGVDTVTINTAPMPLDETTAKILLDKGTAHINTQDDAGRVTSYRFDYPEVLENIMMREDPISSISTVLMDLEGEDSFYTTAAKTIMKIEDALTMDFLISGTQTYLPFDSSNSSYTLGERHSSATVVDIFNSHTDYSVDFDISADGRGLAINKVNVNHNDSVLFMTDDRFSWMITSTVTGEAISGTGLESDIFKNLSAGPYLFRLNALLDDGRIISKEEAITVPEVSKSIKIELLNPSECNSTKYCKIKVGLALAIADGGVSIEWGDGRSALGGLSGSGDREYNYWEFEHTYSSAGTYTIDATATDSEDSNSLSVTVSEVNTTTVSMKLKKTGQTKSYDQYGNEVTDGSVKDDGYYQKGASPNYTRDDAIGIVTDHITGLIWQDNETVEKSWLTQDNFDQCRQTQDDAVCYDVAGDTAQKYCENLRLGTYSNWRLPTRKELLGLLDYGNTDPAIDPAFKHIGSSSYWSSTSSATEYRKDFAWYISFTSGTSGDNYKSTDLSVRCVLNAE